jgi:hypothetical protein
MKKVKRLTAVILSALMMTSAFSALPVSAAEVESNTTAVSSDENFISGDYEYSLLDDGTIEISKYIGSDKEITIPDTIDGKKVTSIGNCVFEHCIGLESITIPENITNIENMAFDYCKNLESINVDVDNNIYSSIDGVLFNKEQDKILFFPYNKSDSYEIPDSVTSIGDGAFYRCYNLTNIIIPDSVTSIGNSAFFGCHDLTNIIIPDSVTSIENYAFCGCANFTSITIPDSVTSIGEGAFSGCRILTSITIPDSVTSISNETFRFCYKLTDIIIPNSVTSIGKMAFEACDLTNITIPNSVTSIGGGAFRYCTRLANITISNSVTSIYLDTFSSCSSLTSIIIPDSVTSIGNAAFADCSSLTNITIPNSVTSIYLETFCSCSSLTSIIIPDSVTSIGNKAFYGCTNLTSITIPKSVTSIGDYTFTDCNNLTIYGYKNSYAEEYAKTNNIKFAVINSLTDTNTNITVSGVMQNDAVLNVAKLENTFENSVATYDITLQKDGVVIQPDGAITVKIPSNAENCKVMWLKDDGTAEDMNAKYTDGCYVFTTDHLSVYALVLNKTILTGDANQDGIIDVNDVTYLQMHIAGKKTTDGSAFIDETNKLLFDCIDMNKDGKLSVYDVTALQIYISNNNPKIN